MILGLDLYSTETCPAQHLTMAAIGSVDDLDRDGFALVISLQVAVLGTGSRSRRTAAGIQTQKCVESPHLE